MQHCQYSFYRDNSDKCDDRNIVSVGIKIRMIQNFRKISSSVNNYETKKDWWQCTQINKNNPEKYRVPGDWRDKKQFAMEERVQMKIKSRGMYTWNEVNEQEVKGININEVMAQTKVLYRYRIIYMS